MDKASSLFRICNWVVIFILFVLLSSCIGKSTNYYGTRCPELVDRMEALNAKSEKTDIKVEYTDSVYRIIQFMDDDKAERYSESLGNRKLFLYKQFMSAKNRVNELLVENDIYFELIIKKRSGEIVSRTFLTPYEMANAMEGMPFSSLKCQELEKEARIQNAKSEGPRGMTVNVEYLDTVYRIIQTIDEDVVPTEKVLLFYGNMKPNMIASLSSSSGKERDRYNQMVDYGVTFEHVAKSKKTGDIIVRTIMAPDEISNALKHEQTRLDQLKININTIKQTLPREMEAGYTITDISIDDEVVTFEILINEGMKNFDEATVIRQWPKENQAITLFDLTTGQTFYGIAAKVPVDINYHFIGSKGKRELTISFSHDEIVKYNDLMNKILENLK